jgi:hypothetical protein
MARNPLWRADAAANIGSSRILHLWCRACADRPSNGYKTSGSVWPRQRAFTSIAKFNRSRQMAAAGPCDPLTAQSLHGRYLRKGDSAAVVTQSKAIDQASARSGCSGDVRGTVNYDRSGVSQRLAHHRLPPETSAYVGRHR